MALTSAGAVLVAQALINDSPTLYTNGNSSIGVGDSATAFAIGQTDLQAASNKFRKGMEATYPQRSAGAITFRSLYGTAEANFAWAEWGTFNTTSASGGTMLNRKVEALGTKTSASSWQFSVTLTCAAT